MLPDLYSTRLRLRPLSVADEERYVALFTTPSIMDHVGPTLSRPAASLAFRNSIEMMVKQVPEAWLWFACTGYRAKDAGLFGLVIREGRPEIGAMVVRDQQGKGFAYEALSCVRDYGFVQLNLSSQFGRQLASNQRSIGLMLKLGFNRIPDRSQHVHWRLDRDQWSHQARQTCSG